MKKIQGFTMAEVIIVVAVLAIVFTLAMPDMTKLFDRHNQMLEVNRLNEIYKSLDLYTKNNRRTPAVATWYDDLAQYTELSSDQIRYDVWNIERSYGTFSSVSSYLGTSYNVYYATVLSAGIDKNFSHSLPTNVSEFTNFNATNNIFSKSGEDYAIKYTDQSHKISLLETTLDRMEKLSLALERYARVKQIDSIADDPDQVDNLIYYPKDGRGNSDPAASKYFSTVDEIDTTNNATSLAKTLGLPEEYGIDAVTGGNMWYISNPGNDGADICDDSRSTAPFYPPIIMVSATNPC